MRGVISGVTLFPRGAVTDDITMGWWGTTIATTHLCLFSDLIYSKISAINLWSLVLPWFYYSHVKLFLIALFKFFQASSSFTSRTNLYSRALYWLCKIKLFSHGMYYPEFTFTSFSMLVTTFQLELILNHKLLPVKLLWNITKNDQLHVARKLKINYHI